MASTAIYLILAFCAIAHGGILPAVPARIYTQMLNVSNPYTGNDGKWGVIQFCAEGSFASAIEARYMAPGHLDETAVNVIKLYCTTEDHIDTGYITSSQGDKGDWYGMQICSTDFITGFRANVLSYQGIFVDDVAIEDFEVDCNYGEEIVGAIPIPVPMAQAPTPYDFKEGEWSTFSICRTGAAVCGIQTRYEDGSLGDEAAITDVILFCCERFAA